MTEQRPNPHPCRYIQSQRTLTARRIGTATLESDEATLSAQDAGVETDQHHQHVRARLDQLLRRKAEREGSVDQLGDDGGGGGGSTLLDLNIVAPSTLSRKGLFKPAQVELCSLPYIQQHESFEVTTGNGPGPNTTEMADGSSFAPSSKVERIKSTRQFCCRALESESIETLDSHGRWPLHVAAMCGHVHCASCLVDLGASVTCVESSKYERTALFLACASGHLDIVQLLLSSTTAQAQARELRNSSSASPDTDTRGDTPLHAACYIGDAAIVRVLLDHGANPNAFNIKRHLPAHLCSSAEALRVLHEYGADMVSQDKRKRTPLFHACAKQRADCVEFLCCVDEARVAIHVSDMHGDMPLHACVCTAAESAVQCVDSLLQYGADPLMRNNQGYLASDIADFYSTNDSAQLLRSYEAYYLNQMDAEVVQTFSDQQHAQQQEQQEQEQQQQQQQQQQQEEDGEDHEEQHEQQQQHEQIRAEARRGTTAADEPQRKNGRTQLYLLARSLRLNRDYAALADRYDEQRPYRQLGSTSIVCTVCEHNEVDMVCMPCEHKCICNDCITLHKIGGVTSNACAAATGSEAQQQDEEADGISQIKKCPICRERIAKVVSTTCSDQLSQLRWYGSAAILPSSFTSAFRKSPSVQAGTDGRRESS